MPTAEEMNVEIYSYMGTPSPICKDIEGNDFKMDFTPIYNKSWDALMKVWVIVKNELRNCMLPDSGEVGAQAEYNLEWIKSYVSDANITEAHRLIYEAIVWLKNKG